MNRYRTEVFLCLICLCVLASLSCGISPSTSEVVRGSRLKGDGSDNCSAWQDLLSSTSPGTTISLPQGTFFSSCGFVFTKPVNIAGSGMGYFDGEIRGATKFTSPILLNQQPGVTITDIATDCRNWLDRECEGISSGAASTNGGGTTIRNYLYVGTQLTNESHAVLLQSGPRNEVENIDIRDAFHGFVIRSSDTKAVGVHLHDSYDVVVKAAAGSDSVSDVSISHADCDGEGLPGGCVLNVVAYDGKSVSNLQVSDMFCRNSPYCFVLYADTGSMLDGIKVTSLAGVNIGTGIYAWRSGTGLINRVTLEDVCFSGLYGQLLYNSGGADVSIAKTCNP